MTDTAQGVVSAEAAAFIRRHINSVELFEVLLFLFHRAEHPSTADEVRNELRSSAVSIEGRLANLTELGLAQREEGTPPRYRFHCPDELARTVIAELARVYDSHRYTVINMIFSKPPRDVETFADAFRIRPRKKDG